MEKLTPPPIRQAWAIWGLGAILYLIGFYQRVAPAVMTAELMNDFQINAATLGNLSAFYAVAFVGMLKLATHWFAPHQFALYSEFRRPTDKDPTPPDDKNFQSRGSLDA